MGLVGFNNGDVSIMKGSTVLGILAGISGLLGFVTILDASNVLQQIVGLVLFLMASVFLSSSVITGTVRKVFQPVA